jgi:hypothetical protein
MGARQCANDRVLDQILCVAGIAIPAARFALQEGHFKFEQAPKIFNRRVAFPMTRIVNHERAIFP